MSAGENPAVFPEGVSMGSLTAVSGGLTLRDWLAGEAPVTLYDAAVTCGWSGLQAVDMPKDDYRATLWAVMALMRYEYADAMLAERAKGGAA